MSSVISNSNPRKWRFTWEAQSHIPILRLFLFNSHINPLNNCLNLKVDVSLSQSLVVISWFEDSDAELKRLLRAPIPRVLVDAESPVSSRSLDDHIEVKLALLLPVDHPLVSSFGSFLDSSITDENSSFDSSNPLSMNSDAKCFSSCGGLHFYCRNCSVELTKSPLRNFEEMPSVDWREVADNWFGACCCSFGGISEKLVVKFVNSYTCKKARCLMNSTTIILSKDDLVGCNFPELEGYESSKPEQYSDGNVGFGRLSLNVGSNRTNFEKTRSTTNNDGQPVTKFDCEAADNDSDGNHLSHIHLQSDISANVDLAWGCCTHHVSQISSDNQKPNESLEILEDQKCFLNGLLGNIFMLRSSNLSSDVEWIEFSCPQCSCLLGAYPTSNGRAPLDGGVRIFKCCISTSLPVAGSQDLLRNYTLEKMFINQLLDYAKDELSFRTVVRDMKTKSPVLLIVLVNTNSWSCGGFCLDIEDNTDPPEKIDLQPVAKVLFSECSNKSESQIREIEDYVKKDLADEVFMFPHQIEELVRCLSLGRDTLPPSYSFLQDLSLSSLKK